MSKRRATKSKTAPRPGASKTTPKSRDVRGISATPVVANTTARPAKFPINAFYDTLQFSRRTRHFDVGPRESCTCVINLELTTRNRSTSTKLGWHNEGYLLWSGYLWDAARLEDHQNDGTVDDPINEIFADDDTDSSRQDVIQKFRAEAQALGYTYCELRDGSPGGPDELRYTPLFGGLLSEMSATF